MSQKQGILKILGFAVSLPGSILGSYFFGEFLKDKGLIKPWMATGLVVVTVAYVLYLMIRYALKQ